MQVTRRMIIHAAIVVAMGLSATFAQKGKVERPWYEEKSRAGANFYDIVKAHRSEVAAKQSARNDDLTAVLLNDPELIEQGKDYQFNRWRAYVEPRVYPSGDMSLLDIGYAEAARLVLHNQSASAASFPEDNRGAWEAVGPFAGNTYGAGRLNWLEFHPTNDSAMMVGSPSGGLWFTKDAGKNWATTTDGIAVLGAAWAVYHPLNPDIIYLGTGDGVNGDTKSVGVLKSVDAGKTWNTTGLTFEISSSILITKLSMDARKPDRLLVATSKGVQYSRDGGNTFVRSTFPSNGVDPKVWDLAINPGNPDIVYASTNILYRSTDGGKTFSAVPGAPTSSYRMLIAVTPAEPSWVYLLRGASNATEGVSLSVNDGVSFANKGAATEVGCDQASYDYAFAANPTNADEVAAGCMWIFSSEDQGVNWRRKGSGYHEDIQGLFYRKDGTLFVTNDGGIWHEPSTFLSSWTNINNNLNIGQSYRIGAYRYDYDRICTGRQDNGTDISDGGGFKSMNNGDGFECFWNNTGTRFYSERENAKFNGCNYSNGQVSVCDGVTHPNEDGPWNTPWAHDPKEATTLYAGMMINMWKSTDNGAKWTQMGTLGGVGRIITNFKVAPSNNQVIYVLKGLDVFKTANGGQSWTNVGGAITEQPVSVSVSANDPNDVWVTVSGFNATSKVWHSVNGGQSWVNETSVGLPNLPANAVVMDDLGGVYVGMDVGVYYRNKGRNAWSNFSGGLPNVSIRELEIAQKGANQNDRRLLAATYGRGVWRSRLWDDQPVAAGPKAPILRGFSAVVTGKTLRVRFQLGADHDEEGMATLQLNAADGTMIHQEKMPIFGFFEREISLAPFGKGVFFFVLRTGGGSLTRRVAVY